MSAPTPGAGLPARPATLRRRWGRFATERWGIVCLLGLGAGQALLWLLPLAAQHPRSAFAWRAMLLFGLQLASLAVAWNRRDRATLVLVLLLALLFRGAVWRSSPVLSDDLYRYVWDGRVQLSGTSPYALPPSSEALASLRDEAVWPRINRPDAVTVYPPGAQLAFLAFASLGGDSVGELKATAIALELIALGLVLLLLRRRGLPGGRLIAYAWSPLLIAEIAGSGHLDALLLPLLGVACVLAERRRFAAVGAIIGAAALVKLYPVLLLAALPRRAWPRAGAAAALTVLCGYLPYAWWSGTGVIGFLPQYVGVAEDFNSGVRFAIEGLLAWALPHPRQLAMLLCGAMMLGLLAALPRLAPGDREFPADARRVIMTFLLLLPTAVHPWYALWLLPFLALRPTAAGVWLIGILPLSYLKYDAVGEQMPGWVLAVQWAPAVALVCVPWLGARGREVATRA